MRKLSYKPVGLMLGALAGALAGVAFRSAWRAVTGEQDTPDPIDEGRGWGEVLMAAALQGALFALVRAAADRVGATGVRKVTGTWPGSD